MYVYRHIRKDTDKVFYVGIGTGNRYLDKHNRSKYWKDIVKLSDFEAEIIIDNLSSELAVQKEKEFISIYKDTLCNRTIGGNGCLEGVSVKQYDLYGNFIKSYKSITEAACTSNVSIGNVTECCQGKRDMVGGYQWSYIDDDREEYVSRRYNKKSVGRYDKVTGELLEIYNSITEAANSINYSVGSLQEACCGKRKSAKGYKWNYI